MPVYQQPGALPVPDNARAIADIVHLDGVEPKAAHLVSDCLDDEGLVTGHAGRPGELAGEGNESSVVHGELGWA